MTTTFIPGNNINTTLAAAAASSATTLTLASSANLPTLTGGAQMPLTLNDAATGQIYEVVYVTAITGATLTVLRAQEGTGAQNWNIGDFAFCAPTEGTVAQINGNPNQQFQVAPATASNQAVQLGQLSGLVGGLYGVRGLIGLNGSTPATQMSFSATLIGLWNPTNGLVSSVSAGSAMNNIAVATAANGRDQAAAFTANSWVYFYFIWNGTTLASVSSANPPSSGPVLSALSGGYTSWAYLCAVRWNGTTLSQVEINGAWLNYITSPAVLVGGTATTLTPVSVAAVVPPPIAAPQFEISINNLAITSGAASYSLTATISLGGQTGAAFTYGLQGPGAPGVIAGVAGPSKRMSNANQIFNYILAPTVGTGPATTIVVAGYSNANGDS